MHDLLSRVPEAPMPTWLEPALGVRTENRFADPDWIFERKLDGERILVFRDGDQTRLMTRNRNDVGSTYPELVDAIAGQPARRLIADGEVVAFDGNLTSFSRLQGRMQIDDETRARDSGIRVFLYLFDLLHFEGRDVARCALRDRKRVLKHALQFADPLRYTPHRNEEGEALFEDACARGWEGLIAKDGTAPYVHGRTRKWLKFKCGHGQEFVIGGFTEPSGARKGFGALLLGVHEAGELRYAGKVGTGFDDRHLRDLREKLDARRRETSPFRDEVGEAAHWVRPDLVAEVGFAEWTRAGKLRHPRFLGLRRDKPAEDVHREDPA
jgi:DNA ligase D-like protein (predicted ligase)